jgi:preprotein translocase subunit YajC
VYSLIILVVLFGALWFFMIRPQQRRAAEQRAMRSAVDPGSEVMLTSGIYGTVVEKTDDHILVRIAEGVEIRVVPAAIGNVLPPADDTDALDDPDDEGDESESGSAEPASSTLAPESTVDLTKPEEH